METIKSLETLSQDKKLNLKQVYLDTQIQKVIDILNQELVGLKLVKKNNSRNFCFISY